MSPAAVLAELEKRGIKIDRSTLTRWAALGIVSKPTITGLGQARGKASDYPDCTVDEAAVARRLITNRRASKEAIGPARQLAYELEQNPKRAQEFMLMGLTAGEIDDSDYQRYRHACSWLVERQRFEEGLDPTIPQLARITFSGDGVSIAFEESPTGEDVMKYQWHLTGHGGTVRLLPN